jgi:hypothetical protein
MRGGSGFRARGARPFANFLQNGRRGIAWHYGNGDDAAARCFHFLAAHDLVARPIIALYQNIWKQAGDDLARREIIENHYRVNGFQCRENLRAPALGDDWAAGALQLPDAGVAVQPDDEHIAQLASTLEAAYVTWVKQVKAAVGEDHAAAVAFPAAKLQNRFLNREYRRIQRISMQAQRRNKISPETLVYHAPEARRARARTGR